MPDQAARRDARRVLDVPVEELELADASPRPDEIVEREELESSALKRLTPGERELLTLRAEGRTWPAIAAQLGDRVDRLRKMLRRALERVRSQLGDTD